MRDVYALPVGDPPGRILADYLHPEFPIYSIDNTGDTITLSGLGSGEGTNVYAPVNPVQSAKVTAAGQG